MVLGANALPEGGLTSVGLSPSSPAARPGARPTAVTSLSQRQRFAAAVAIWSFRAHRTSGLAGHRPLLRPCKQRSVFQ